MNILNKNDIIFLVIIMKLNLNEWMKGINGKENLFSLSIPGTHDSVTKYVQFSYLTRCQNKSIFDQLNLGIRALDIRVKSDNDKLAMVHSIAKAYASPYRNAPQLHLDYVLEHCYKFLEKHPSETIVFQFKNDNNKENEKCFDNLFYTYIKGNEDKWYLKAKVPTLDEARGKLVLIRRCKLNEENEEFNQENTGIDFSSWVEQDELVPNALELETNSIDNAVFIIQDRYKYKPEPRWDEVIKPFLDSREGFDGKYIICYFSTAGGKKGPKANAEIINTNFLNYTIDKNKYYGTIYLDFPTEEIVWKIINHNFCEKKEEK